MRKLASYIAAELQTAKHCAVYEPDLTRAWPHHGEKLREEIELFAKRHHFRLRFFQDGLCAIFDKEVENTEP